MSGKHLIKSLILFFVTSQVTLSLPTSEPKHNCSQNSTCSYFWMETQQWSECSATCGGGTQTQSVFCFKQSGEENITKVDDSHCDESDKYETSRSCIGEHCEGGWFAASWEECSATCNGGFRTRTVVCLKNNKIVDDEDCDLTTKPSFQEYCNTEPCDKQDQDHSNSVTSHCADSLYGCCPDGVSFAQGSNYAGCDQVHHDPHGSASPKSGNSCGLIKDGGPCSDYEVKWHFDMESGQCIRFWYGGCEGNDNKFGSEEECNQICVHPEGMNVCQLPMVTGPCRSYVENWYYDATSGQCSQFYYGGCNGNNNRFETREKCEEFCGYYK